MYHIIIKEKNKEWILEDIKDLNHEHIKAMISEELANELASFICSNNPSYEKAIGAGFSWDDMEEINAIIEDVYRDSHVDVLNDNDEVVASYSLLDLYKVIIADYLASENGDIEICHLWSAQLENYINLSRWQVALKSNDGGILYESKDWPMPSKREECKWIRNGQEYTPIMWFGPVGDEILEEWVVQNEGIAAIVSEEDGMGSYGGQMRIQGYEINYLHFFEDNGSWYFGACGEAGADFHKVVESCPIDLLSIYTNKNGNELVLKYFLKLQGI